MTKPLGDFALGEVRRWANTCDDEGGRLYALPLVDAYEELRAEHERLRAALEEIASTEGNLHSSWHVQTARASLERP